MLKPYCYAFVRTDIPTADQGVQLAHATLEAGKYFKHPDDVHLIVIGLSDKKKLLQTAEKLVVKGVAFRMFFEPDDNMEETAIATEPLYGEQRKFLRNFELWKPPA